MKYLAVLLLLTTTACAPPEKPIRIGVNPWPGYELLVVAADRGWTNEAGVEVQIVEYASLGDVRLAYEQGWIDGMATTLVEVVQAAESSSRSPRIVLVTDFSDGADVVLAGPDIRTVPDLVGRRIGIEHGTLNLFLLTRALQIHGIDRSQVELIPIPQIEMPEAFADGIVDAVVTYPPISVEIARNEHQKIFSSAEIPGEIIDVLSIDETVLHERSNDVAAILRAWDRALRWSRESPEEAHDAMANRLRVSIDELRESLDELQMYTLADQPPLFAEEGPMSRALHLISEVLSESEERGELQISPEDLLHPQTYRHALGDL